MIQKRSKLIINFFIAQNYKFQCPEPLGAIWSEQIGAGVVSETSDSNSNQLKSSVIIITHVLIYNSVLIASMAQPKKILFVIKPKPCQKTCWSFSSLNSCLILPKGTDVQHLWTLIYSPFFTFIVGAGAVGAALKFRLRLHLKKASLRLCNTVQCLSPDTSKSRSYK